MSQEVPSEPPPAGPSMLEIPPKKLVGMRIKTSLAEQRTQELWQQFKSRLKEIDRGAFEGYYSIQYFPKDLTFQDFHPHTLFEKWAAVEVAHFENIPVGMESHLLAGGKYAVFIHHGPVSTAQQTLQYIFEDWLPNSGFELDNRAHFEFMGEDYRPLDPNATEAFWIPIQ